MNETPTRAPRGDLPPVLARAFSVSAYESISVVDGGAIKGNAVYAVPPPVKRKVPEPSEDLAYWS